MRYGAMKENLIGKKFNYLTVLKKVESKDKKHSYYLCRCECGNEKIIRSDTLKDERYVSCGCYNRSKIKGQKSLKHGQSRTKLYHVWAGMKNRCRKASNYSSKWYYDKSVKVYEEWLSFEKFYEWCIQNNYREGLTIDRIDYNGDYEPSNCRWVTMKEQNFNTSRNVKLTYNDKTYCMQQWADTLGVNRNTFWRYIRVKNMSIEEIINKYNIKCIDYPKEE